MKYWIFNALGFVPLAIIVGCVIAAFVTGEINARAGLSVWGGEVCLR